jgi:tetratricopeptide (TPR) repeat protein
VHAKRLKVAAVVGLSLLLLACGGAEERKAKYLASGKALMEQADYAKARLELRNVLKIDPKDVGALYLLGQLEEKQQNWRKAYAYYQQVVELDSSHVDARLKLAQIYLLSNDADKALEQVTEVLKLAPDKSDALVMRGIIAGRKGDNEAAFRDASQVLEKDPANIPAATVLSANYEAKGDLTNAIAVLERSSSQNPKEASLQLLLARLYEKSGQSEKSAQALKQIIALQPQEFSHRLRLARYYNAHGQQAEAEQILRDAIAADATAVPPKLALIELIGKQQGFEAAEQSLRGFIEQEPKNHTLRFGLADLYRSAQREQQVMEVYREIIKLDGEGKEGIKARNSLAGYLLAQKKVDEADTLTSEVLKADPKNQDGLINRAAVALVREQPDAAITDLRAVLKEQPNAIRAMRLLARAHLQKKEVELARDTLQKALQSAPQERELYLELAQISLESGDAKAAIATLEQLNQALPNDQDGLRRLAELQLNDKQWGSARETAEKLKAAFPDQPLGYYLAGLSHQGEQVFETSIKEFQQALDRSPNAIEPLVAISRSYLALNQVDAALANLEKTLKQNPQHSVALNLKGEILLGKRDHAAAEAAFRRAIEVSPKFPAPYLNMAKLQMARKEPQQAAAVLKQGHEATGEMMLWLQLANLYEASGQVDQAINEYRAILASSPQIEVAANNLAALLSDRDNPTLLKEALTLAKQFENSKNPLYRDTLGWVYYRHGDMAQAIAHLEEAQRLAPNVAVINYHLGLSYQNAGRTEEAKARLRAALEQAKGESWISDARGALAKLGG